jgi:hypothetical protein
MPKGPKGEKRPADVIGTAVKVMRIATGEEEEEVDEQPKSAAAELGAKGGTARAKNLTAEQRAEIARKARLARFRLGKGKAERWNRNISWSSTTTATFAKSFRRSSSISATE